MKRSVSYTVAALLIVIALLAAALLAYRFSGSSSPSNPEPAKIKLANVGYLNDSQVYLISGSLERGSFESQECFVANVTVRNDYQPDNFTSDGRIWVFLQAKLFSKTDVIPATNIGPTNLFIGDGKGLIFSLGSNETDTGPIYVLPNNHDLNLGSVDSFEVELLFVGPMPPP